MARYLVFCALRAPAGLTRFGRWPSQAALLSAPARALASQLDKYLTTTIKLWDKNGDGAISQSEFRLAVRNKPLSIKADNKEVDALVSRQSTPLLSVLPGRPPAHCTPHPSHPCAELLQRVPHAVTSIAAYVIAR